MCCVVVMLECPSLLATLAIDTPAKSNKEAWVWRKPWMVMAETLALWHKRAVDGGVVNWVWMMEYRLLRRQVFHQLRKLNHGLPINLDFAHRRAIFGGGKATFFL